ncbi:MAG: PaaI family thioesterase [Actinomycetes bacterium]
MSARIGRVTVPPPDLSIPLRHPDAPAPGAPMPVHWSQCVCCSPTHPAGLQLSLIAGEGLTVHGQFEITALHQGAPGLAHGGLLAAALDESMATLNWLVGAPSVTARLEIDFRRPVPVGTTLHIIASVVAADQHKVFTRADGHLDSAGGPVAISATGLFVQVPGDHFVRHGRGIDIQAAMIERDERLSQRDFEVNP